MLVNIEACAIYIPFQQHLTSKLSGQTFCTLSLLKKKKKYSSLKPTQKAGNWHNRNVFEKPHGLLSTTRQSEKVFSP